MSPLAKLHAISGTLALALIGTFWISTVLVEMFGSHEAIATAKTAILWGFGGLVPTLALAGGSGNRLGRGWRTPVIARKRRRMAFAAANGLLVLIPSAFVLARWAAAGQFGTAFVLLQATELTAGAINITLLGRNLGDGLSLRKRR